MASRQFAAAVLLVLAWADAAVQKKTAAQVIAEKISEVLSHYETLQSDKKEEFDTTKCTCDSTDKELTGKIAAEKEKYDTAESQLVVKTSEKATAMNKKSTCDGKVIELESDLSAMVSADAKTISDLEDDEGTLQGYVTSLEAAVATISQIHGSSFLQMSGAPAYTVQSGSIFGMLSQMLDSFKTELAGVKASLSSARTSSATAQGAARTAIADKKAECAGYGQAEITAQGEMTVLVEQSGAASSMKETLEGQLSALKAECERAVTTYDAEEEELSRVIQSLNKAQSIIQVASGKILTMTTSAESFLEIPKKHKKHLAALAVKGGNTALSAALSSLDSVIRDKEAAKQAEIMEHEECRSNERAAETSHQDAVHALAVTNQAISHAETERDAYKALMDDEDAVASTLAETQSAKEKQRSTNKALYEANKKKNEEAVTICQNIQLMLDGVKGEDRVHEVSSAIQFIVGEIEKEMAIEKAQEEAEVAALATDLQEISDGLVASGGKKATAETKHGELQKEIVRLDAQAGADQGAIDAAVAELLLYAPLSTCGNLKANFAANQAAKATELNALGEARTILATAIEG